MPMPRQSARDECLATRAASRRYERLSCEPASAMAVNVVLPVGMFPAAGVKAERLDGIMVIAQPDGCGTGTGNAVPVKVRRMASKAPMARRRAVSITDRMSA